MTEQKTICTTCLRLKQGLCDGEKELTACPSYKRMTNADRIRAMTDEELANFMEALPDACPPMRTLCSGKNCNDCWLDWVKQEVKDNA